MIDTFEAYEFLYKAVVYYGQNKDRYDKLLKFGAYEEENFNTKKSNCNSQVEFDEISAEYLMPWSC